MNVAIAIEWRQRERTIEPSALFVDGAHARTLARQWLDHDRVGLAGMRGVATQTGLFVLGEAERLPWARGVTYFGRDPRAPGPLWPTAVEPTAPPALVARALARACPGPFAAMATPPHLIGLAEARAIHPDALAAWLADADAPRGAP